MILLLDTQVLVWSQVNQRQLTKAAVSAMQRARKRGDLAVSVFTLYEVAGMMERGRLDRRGSIETSLRYFTDGIAVKPITLEIAALAVEFPQDFPRDPGDRIIAATARVENVPLITADERIRACKLVKTIW